jgi:hypothetical protein
METALLILVWHINPDTFQMQAIFAITYTEGDAWLLSCMIESLCL